jgi:hypothetical protein
MTKEALNRRSDPSFFTSFFRGRQLVVIALLHFAVLAVAVYGQARRNAADKGRDVLSMIVAQPDSPIRIDNFGVDNTGAGKDTYSLTNTSNKSIRSYRIARYFDDGTGFLGRGALPSSGVLLPGRSASQKRNESTVQSRAIKRIGNVAWIMVVDVEFADGTAYSDEKRFNILVDYFMTASRHLN